MELETTSPPTEDAVRLAASAREHTIQPISAAVIPEEVDAVNAVARLSATARTKNPENDSEDTSLQLQRYVSSHTPDAGSQPKKTVLFTSIAVACFFFAAFLWLTIQ